MLKAKLTAKDCAKSCRSYTLDPTLQPHTLIIQAQTLNPASLLNPEIPNLLSCLLRFSRIVSRLNHTEHDDQQEGESERDRERERVEEVMCERQAEREREV